MDYVLQGFGVFLGVIAGTAVTILVQWYQKKRAETQRTRNLKFELDLDIRKIDTWLEEFGRFRNATNGDSLHTYVGYFDLSRMVSYTTHAMFESGLLYKKLTHEQIGRLQEIFSFFSGFGEQFLNNQLNQFKQEFERCRAENDTTEWATTTKPQVVSFLNYWEGRFREHQRALKEIVESVH